MKPAAALLLVLTIVIQAFLVYGVYGMRASTLDVAEKARMTLAGLPPDRSASISLGGAQLSEDCSKTLRSLIEASAVRDSALGGALTNGMPLLLSGLALQVALGVVLFMVPGRVWQRIDG